MICSCYNFWNASNQKHTHTDSQIFCVCVCRVVGSEAICSTARSEETQRRFLWQETGMAALIDQQSLDKLRLILSASDLKHFALLTLVWTQTGFVSVILLLTIAILETLLAKSASLSLDVKTFFNIMCIYRTKQFSNTPTFWPKSAFSKHSQPFSHVKRFPHYPVFIASMSIQGRRRTAPPIDRSAVVTPAASKVNHLYGVKAWKSWVQQRNKHLTESELQFSLLFHFDFRISLPLTH